MSPLWERSCVCVVPSSGRLYPCWQRQGEVALLGWPWPLCSQIFSFPLFVPSASHWVLEDMCCLSVSVALFHKGVSLLSMRRPDSLENVCHYRSLSRSHSRRPPRFVPSVLFSFSCEFDAGVPSWMQSRGLLLWGVFACCTMGLLLPCAALRVLIAVALFRRGSIVGRRWHCGHHWRR